MAMTQEAFFSPFSREPRPRVRVELGAYEDPLEIKLSMLWSEPI